ncbi:MAG TPA: hypothetical protein VGK39_01165 [Cyclobacteriaceae bacterium]
MKTFSILVFSIVITIAHGQIGAKAQQNKIQGTWLNNSFGYQMTLILNADGSGEFDGEAIKYTTKENKFNMTIVAEQQTISYNYNLQGNSLTVSGGDLEAPVTFTRNGSVTETTSVAQNKVGASVAVDKSLIGVWSGNNETIEFTSNGHCVYTGQTYPYEISGSNITLQTSQGGFVMAYMVKGNLLSLTVNGQTIQYTKGKSATAQNKAQTTGSGKRVAQELVGKWCYVNVNSTNSGGSSSQQCITLKADGTYEYYGESSRSVNTNAYSGGTSSQSSDHGTWTYDGVRVYYTSSAGAGSGSYSLEKRNHPKNNDPMIVLDGVTYVTFYQKDPWR